MKSRSKLSGSMVLVLLIGAIPASILLENYFGVPAALSIPLVVILLLFCGTVALWSHANRHKDKHPWWEDDNASGWRGY